LAEIERAVIEATLARHGGSVPRAARVLELSPSTLYRKIEGWSKA
jgi:DNA-binding NtrC family response regulator